MLNSSPVNVSSYSDRPDTLPGLPGNSPYYMMSDEMFRYFISKHLTIDTDETLRDDFARFLKESEDCVIRLDGYNGDGASVANFISGLHRWKTEYKKRIYAKLHQLNPWYEKNRTPITMVTFTTQQKTPDGKPMEKWEQIDLLKLSFNKAKKMLNKYVGKFSYIWIMEPHETGFAHIHMLMFAAVPREIRKQLAEMWRTKYCPGSSGYKDSMKFGMAKTQRSLRSVGAYVFKYIEKTLDFDLLKNVESGYFKLSSWVWKMSRRDTDYKGVRFWGCSRDLSSVMAYVREDVSDTIWWRVSWRLPGGGMFPLWIDEEMLDYPDRIEQFDSDLVAGLVKVRYPVDGPLIDCDPILHEIVKNRGKPLVGLVA